MACLRNAVLQGKLRTLQGAPTTYMRKVGEATSGRDAPPLDELLDERKVVANRKAKPSEVVWFHISSWSTKPGFSLVTDVVGGMSARSSAGWEGPKASGADAPSRLSTPQARVPCALVPGLWLRMQDPSGVGRVGCM